MRVTSTEKRTKIPPTFLCRTDTDDACMPTRLLLDISHNRVHAKGAVISIYTILKKEAKIQLSLIKRHTQTTATLQKFKLQIHFNRFVSRWRKHSFLLTKGTKKRNTKLAQNNWQLYNCARHFEVLMREFAQNGKTVDTFRG